MDCSQVLTTLTQWLCRRSAGLVSRVSFSVCVGGAGLVAGLSLVNSGAAIAEEPVLQFVEGLRERAYFDTALEFLDVAQQRAELSGTIRDLIDLERAKTFQAMGTSSRVPEDRDLYLQQAKEALEKFTSAHSNHPQAAFANSMLGELLLERARTLIWQMEGAESPDKRTEYQLAARKLIDEGQVIYQTANDQYKAAFDAFPNFIDKTKDEEQYDARLDVEAKYLRAWFNLIRCTYERGQTFDKGTEERKTTLINAANLYEALHTRYRTNQIGLHARLMMGKCYQEQDDLSRALGIYNEMLGHTSESDSVELLKGIALHYRLICLNDPQRNDNQLVVQEATIWLQANKVKMSTPYGLGILWERAIAAEKLGAAREITEKDREVTLRVALNDATTVGRYQGAYREPASAMSRRIKASLGDKDKEPKDFATAFERARNMIAQIQALSDDVTAAADAHAQAQKKAALDAHLHEVGRLLQMALDLRDSDSDVKAVAQARYLQSFVMLKLGRPLDSMILARHCMIYDRATDPDTALNATEIAMAAAVAAWNMAASRDRDFETRALKDVCQKILELYPQSSRGGEARMRLATVYRTMNEPLEAAKWYLEVPETDPQYASARISAGQSYWAAWTQKAAVAAEDAEGITPPPAEMQTWKAEARNLLTQGIQVSRDKVGPDSKPSDEVVAAEVSLASILNLDGDFSGTIGRLTGGEANSVVAAIQVAEGEVRPEDGILSKSFAGLTYRLLLRAYVGTQQIELALGVMTQLENVGGQNILAVYTQLGLELQEELKRLKLSGDNERLAQTRDSFEKFLLKVYESRNKSDYNSLLWIGETYFGLGQGVATDPIASAGYYAKAADAYNEIISGGLAKEGNRTAVQLRLARCRRQQKKFDEAFRMCDEILKENPNALDAQFEVAEVLSDWGSESEPAKLLDAIQGIKTPDGKAGHIWGWSLMTRKLQQSLQRTPTPEIRQRFVDARYQLTNSRRRYAKTNATDSDKQLNSALAEVTSFVQVYRDLDDPSFAKFDRLYQDLQTDKGDAPVPLERASGAGAAVAEPEIVDETAKESSVASSPTAVTQPKESAGNGLLLGGVITCLSLGIAGGMFFFMRRPSRRPTFHGSEKAPKFSAVVVSDPGASQLGSMFPEIGDNPAPGLDFSGLATLTTVSKQKTGVRPTGATTATRGANPAVAPRTKPAAATPTNVADSQAVPKRQPRPAAEGASGATAAGAPQRPVAPPTGAQQPGAKPATPRPVAQQPPSAGKPPGPPAARPPQQTPPIPPSSN
ncbi:MAG: hypothetical protein DWI22_21310 [Planctomycetota bacterium]|nr:MAG: hypothetical protein DWI22_21310 [Planctomycetota bacterium]